MSKCIYTYNNVEYSDKESLQEALREELASKKTINLNKNNFIITGEQNNLEFQEMVLKEEAMQQFGTSEHISTEIKGNQLFVSIDPKALEDLTSGEKLLFNEDTGKLQPYKIQDLIDKENNGETIPNIRNWKEEKSIFYANKVLNRINNAKLEPPNGQDLKQRLYSFAQRLGIKVETLENWLKDNAARIGSAENVTALADMLTRTIAVSNEEDLDQLTEEVAHFAIEYSADQPIIEKMIEKVHETDAYKAEAEKYRLIYSELTHPDGTKLTKQEVERKVRKEILGKILADKIKDNFSTQTAKTSSEVGIISQLKDLWDKFIDLFKINDENKKFFKEFGSILDDLANQVIDVEDRRFVPSESKEVYFSLNPQQKRVHDNITKFVDRLQKSYRNIINQKGLDKATRKVKLDEIANALSYSQYGKVLNSAAAMFEDDVSNAILLINKAKQQKGNLVDNIEVDEIINVLNFNRNFKIFSTILDKELDNLKRNSHLFPADTLKKEDIDYIKKKVKLISKQYGAIEDDVRELVNESARKKIEQVYTEEGASKEVIQDVLETMDNGYFDNIFFAKEFAFALRGISNPIFQAIHSMMAVAEREAKKAVNNFSITLSNLVKKYNISDKDAKWLKRGYSLRNGQYTYAIDTWLSIPEKEYKDKINKAKTPQEKEKLITEMDNALQKIRRIWLEQSVTDDKLKELDDLSSGAKNIIFKRSADKKKIFDKYRLSNGTIPVENISNKDFVELTKIEAAYKQNMSPYERDGSLKEGELLQVAFDLIKYRDDIIKGNEDSEYDYEKFKQEALTQGIDLEKPYNLTEPQKKWLAQNTIYTYPQDVLDQLDADGGSIVDTEEMPILAQNIIDEILSNLVIRYKDSTGKIQNTLPNPSIPNSPENYQAIYDSLLAKRQSIVAPFKVQGRAGEIDGIVLDDNPQVLDAINIVNRQLANFVLLKRTDITVIQEGNDAYNKKITELASNPTELRNFKNNVAKVKFIRGVEVPTAYHYKRSRLADADRNKYPKVYQPNFRYKVNEEAKSFYNPKYNRKYAGKTHQLKLDNKELDTKIPKEIVAKLKEEFVEVEDGMTYRDLFIDKEFFDKFGIDQKTDFWGEKGATKNKGLWEVREYLLSEKEKIDKEYNLFNSLFTVPQTQATIKEITDKGILESMRAQFGLTFLQENDDVIGGDADRITVPKRYITKLPHPDLISDDISRLYGKYIHAGANYKHKNKILPSIQILQEKLKNSTIGESNDPVNTNLYKMLDRWLSVHLYGNLIDELNWVQKGIRGTFEGAEKISPKFAKPVLHTLSKISPAKFLFWFYRYMRNTNLAFHTVVPVVNAINSFQNTAMEHLSENQVSRESLVWATQQTGLNYFQHMTDSASISPKSKMMRLLRYSNLYITPEKMYDGITKNILYRSADEPLFINYRPFSVAIASHALFSIFDSYRLIDGQFININNFKEKNKNLTDAQIKDEWSKYREKSYYNFLKENDAKNTIEIDVAKLEKEGYLNGLSATEKENKISSLENKMIINAEEYQAKIEGQATTLDRPLVYSNPIFMFLALHSQYLLNFFQNRFANKRYNLMENRYEEGNYNTLARVTWNALTDENADIFERMKSFFNIMASSVTFGIYSKGLKGLEEFEQTNIKRSGADLSFYLASMAFFMIMNAAADDDDDENWVKDYIALLATRTLMEIGSTTLPTAVPDILQRVESPVPGFRYIEMFYNLPFLIAPSYDKEIKKGVYEGLTKRERSLLQMTFLNNIYSYYYRPQEKYKATNLYFKTNVVSTPSMLLKKMTEEEK